MREIQRNTEHSDSGHIDDTILFSNEVLDTLFTESPFGILISDLEGNIQKINKTGLEALGSPSEEATKQINLLTFPPLRDAGFSKILHTCITEKISITKEIPYVSKWGKSVVFRFKLIPLCDSEGTLRNILCTFEDTRLIRLSEEKLALYIEIITNTSEPIAVLDSTGKYIVRNNAHRELIGYSDQELEEKTPAVHLGEEVYSQIQQKLVEIGHDRRDVKSTTKDGRVLDLDLVSFTLKDDEGNPKYFVGIERDITQRKIAEKNLRESERRLAEAQAIAHLGYWEWDIIKDETIWSTECYRIFGRTPDDGLITSESFLTLVHPEDIEFVSKSMEEALNEDTLYRIDHRIVRPDGQVRIIHEDAVITRDNDGTPVKMIGTSQDITERIGTERALKESENRYRSLFEYSSVSLWEEDFSKVKEFFDELRSKGIVNFREHFENNPEDVEHCMGLVYVRDVNIASIKLHSVQDKSELVGPLRKSFEKDGLGVFQEELISLAEGNTFFRSQDIRLTVKNKEVSFIFQLNVPPGYEDTLSRVYLSIIDVTETKQAESALQSARDDALFYLDLLGHDITNQLQVIIGGTSLLQYQSHDQSITSKLDDILEAANECAQVIAKVKRTQDLRSLELELRLLDEAIEASIKSISSQYSDAQITYESDVKEARVKTDTFLDILLHELLENAIRHNPKSEKKVWVLLEEEEQGYAMSISDNGIGLSDRRKADLFDRAQRYGGVGLHLIKQIVDKYKGRIQVCDRIPGSSDRGVVFRIWIPRVMSDE